MTLRAPLLGGLLALLSACDRSPVELLNEQIRSAQGTYASAFSPDGTRLMVAEVGESARLWEVAESRIRFTWLTDPDAWGTTELVAYAPDGTVVATVDHTRVMLWLADSGAPLNQIDFPLPVRAIALGEAGALVLVALTDHRAVLYDAINHRVVSTFLHDGSAVNSPVSEPITAVAISADSQYVLTGGGDHTARLWRTRDAALVHRWQHANAVNLVAFHPDSQRVVTAAIGEHLWLRDVRTGETLRQFRRALWPEAWPLPDFPVFTLTTTTVAFAADGEGMLSGHPNGEVCRWELSRVRPLGCWSLSRRHALRPEALVQAVAFDPEPDWIRTESSSGLAQLWRWRGP